MTDERPLPQVGEVWRHYKGGEYEIVALAIDEAMFGDVVVYRSLKDGKIWIRPLNSFMEVKFFDSSPRFERIHSAPQPARGEELVERVAGHIRSRLIFQHEEYVRDLARDIVALCTSEPAQPLAGMEEFEAAAYNYRRVHNSSADAAMQRLLSLYRRALECVPSEEILQLLKHMANEDYAAAHVIDEPDASHLKAQSARMLAYVARVREARRP